MAARSSGVRSRKCNPIPIAGMLFNGLAGRFADRRGHRPVMMTGGAFQLAGGLVLWLGIAAGVTIWALRARRGASAEHRNRLRVRIGSEVDAGQPVGLADQPVDDPIRLGRDPPLVDGQQLACAHDDAAVDDRQRSARIRSAHQQAAERIGLSTRTLRRRIAAGDLTAYRNGPRVICLDPDDVDRLMIRIPTAR